jgi:hypothetical protein
MMRELRELMIPYRKYGVDAEHFFLLTKRSDGMQDIYQALLDDPEVTIDELAVIAGYNNAELAGFKSLCYRLRDRLLDGLLRLPHKGASPVRKQLLKVQKLFVQGIILQQAGQAGQGVEVLKRVVKLATKYEQYDVAYLALPYITKYYSFQELDEKLWKRYQKQYHFIKQQVAGLQLSQERYNLVSYYGLYKSKSHAAQLDQHLEQIVGDFEADGDKYTAYRYINRRAEIEQFYLLRKGNYDACIDKTDAALEILSARPFFNRTTRYNLSCGKVDALLNLNRKQDALEVLLQLEGEVDEGRHNWYKLQRQLALTYALLQDYGQLHDLSIEINLRSDLNKTKANYEMWKIIEAYVVFLVKADKIDRPDSPYHKSYRLGRFLNEVPSFSKDKQGLNTAVLIAQVLYYLVNKRIDMIESRIEALSKYCYRYLRRDETFRANCFIKMLARLPEAEYQPIRTARYVGKYLDHLNSAHRIINTDVFDSEIIPYEVLWQVVTEILPSKGYKRRATSSAQ